MVLPCKSVVDYFNSSKRVTEFSDIIDYCRHLFYFHYRNFHVEFIKRQINEVARNLTRATTFLASFYVFIDDSTYF